MVRKGAPWIAVILAGLLMADYVFYHVPVTQDRFGHSYLSGFWRERAGAYWRLFASRAIHGRSSIERSEIEAFVDQHASEIGLDAALVKAVVWFESGFRADHISTTGAMGLMALMPQTAAQLGVEDPFDPYQNLRGGMAYLKLLTARFPRDPFLAVAAYNAGPSAVERHGGVPPFRETEDYVRSVRLLYDGLKAEQAGRESIPAASGRYSWDGVPGLGVD